MNDGMCNCLQHYFKRKSYSNPESRSALVGLQWISAHSMQVFEWYLCTSSYIYRDLTVFCKPVLILQNYLDLWRTKHLQCMAHWYIIISFITRTMHRYKVPCCYSSTLLHYIHVTLNTTNTRLVLPYSVK